MTREPNTLMMSHGVMRKKKTIYQRKGKDVRNGNVRDSEWLVVQSRISCLSVGPGQIEQK
jgi:hypothetical protein